MKKVLLTVVVLAVLLSACAPAATPTPQVITKVETKVETKIETQVVEVVKTPEPVSFVLWTKEGEADGGLQFVQSLVDAYKDIAPNVTIELVKKTDVEELREDFLTAGLAGNLPDLLWTVNDHAGPFTDAGLIQPVDNLFDLSKYVEAALAACQLDGKTWGVPISSGNHLMLIYNKDLVPEPPKDTEELIKIGLELTKGDTYGLVFNQTEPFWLVPWLGGFKGAVFAADGKTPTLNTQAMIDTLQFLYDIKYTTPIIPLESDYNGADSLFKEGKAGMIINGDWSLGAYTDAGMNFGVAPIPIVKSTGEYPKPYTSGVYFMFAEGVSGAKLEAAKDFVEFCTSANNQALQVAVLKRLPALEAALDNPLISSNPILKGSAAQMVEGTPMPTVSEMRCNWDAMKPEMQAVLANTKKPADAAAAMQAAAEACIAKLQ
ncbi:MAG: extracellular solute-binding protein [Chloroflexi bacterium]|nr:extracellular solute-binding protein [Chloroflexota bacterium]